MDLQTFQALPTAEVAALVRAAGTRVCALPLNGTRRWFALERPAADGAGVRGAAVRGAAVRGAAYLAAITHRMVEIYSLLFDHGLETAITPALGNAVLARGPDYLAMMAQGFARMAAHPDMLAFYARYGVQVRCYGAYRSRLAALAGRYPAAAELLDGLEQLVERTAGYTRRRICFGLLADDAEAELAGLAVAHYRQHGSPPDRDALVLAYYGAPIPPIALYIGFSKLRAYSIPLLSGVSEDLYFMVSPSPTLDQAQLRAILYDHLYARAEGDAPPARLPASLAGFYRANVGRTLGVGAQIEGVWVPLPQVSWDGEGSG